jgi:hypothetical protein
LYQEKIKPLLRERCLACHGALAQKGKLRLDTAALAHRGGRNGPSVLAEKVEDSPLMVRVSRGESEAGRMPPEGMPLTAEQVGWLKDWIVAGARGPADEKPEADPKDHWAFKKPVRPETPPALAPAWNTNPIDRLVAARHQKLGIQPLEVAESETLLRRVYLDLIGLPPTGDELRAFLADNRPDAYERVVDRLLADPRHSERWARHWMDVWRYSDWYGRRTVPDVLNSYGQIWRWRDWIVRSLDRDRPYDEMVRLMLAADELAPQTLEDQPATGFVVRNFFRWNYNNWMRDSIEHTAKAFLGLTMNCCHCHDHKYDPISQDDYFRFRAIFEPVEIRHDRWPDEEDPGVYPKYSYGAAYKPITTGMVRVMDERLTALTRKYSRGDERNVPKDAPAIPPGVPVALGGVFLVSEVKLPPESWYPGLRDHVRQEETAKLAKARDEAKAALDKARAAKDAPAEALAQAGLLAAQSALKALKLRILADDARYRQKGDPAETARLAAWAEKQTASDRARATVLEKEQALASATKAAKPEGVTAATKSLEEAKAKLASTAKALENPGENYSPLGTRYETVTSTGRRSALARWITDPSNPLTARVAANHLWGWHFGQPLVTSTHDFGRSGKPPANQELLDWLAMELMHPSDGTDPKAAPWSMRRLHRLIVTSRTYRTRSGPTPVDHPGRVKDTDNLSLWRFPLGRMQAEVVRDSLLHVAGQLDGTRGGPDIPQDQALTTKRRSLYLTHHGESRAVFLDLFDAANPCEAYQRSASVLPQQALALANSELTHRLAQALAASLHPKLPTDKAFVTAAFEQVLARRPVPEEQAAALEFLSALRETAPPTTPSDAPTDSPTSDPALRAREGLIVALFNHTDFLTIR